MRKIIVSMLFVFGAGSAFAQSAPVFAPNGQYLGTAVKNGDTTLFVDKNGKYGGAVVQNQNGMAIFDENGRQGARHPAWGGSPPQGYGNGAAAYGYGPPSSYPDYGNRLPYPYPGYGNPVPHPYPDYGNRPPNGYNNGFGHSYR